MPPRSFRRIAPGRLEVREGGGCMAVFGLPFLGAGLFMMLICRRRRSAARSGEIRPVVHGAGAALHGARLHAGGRGARVRPQLDDLELGRPYGRDADGPARADVDEDVSR